MLILSGADIVLPDRVITRGSIVIDGGKIVDVTRDEVTASASDTRVDLARRYVIPGFVDVHVHGVLGHDVLDGPAAVEAVAAKIPRYGVTAFCPTTVACAPDRLRMVLAAVQAARAAPKPGSARVLPAHLESNFISPEYRGAQPARCLRKPPQPGEIRARIQGGAPPDGYDGADILAEISRARPDVGIVTLAPELPGGIELVRALTAAGHRVSLGHSGASLDEAIAAIEAGARHATHLFNRMTPMTHRAPGVAGAVLARQDVAAELICDGFHVHPAMCRVAIASKGRGGIIAITDGTGGSGLPVGSSARLGGRHIRVTEDAALLDDGTLAGSTLTMDRAFRTIVGTFGMSVVDAATLCSTTPARELGLTGLGVLAEGAFGDVVVLDRSLQVVRTFIEGQQVYRSGGVE